MSEVKESTYGKITDEAVAGCGGACTRSFRSRSRSCAIVNADSIRHAARAIGDVNPL